MLDYEVGDWIIPDPEFGATEYSRLAIAIENKMVTYLVLELGSEHTHTATYFRKAPE